MPIAIRAASRRRLRLRAAFSGPSKSGKTWKALSVANDVIQITGAAGQLAGNGKVCVIDTEQGRSDQYSDVFPQYDICELDKFSPDDYIAALKAVADADYSVTIVDQISHEWAGKDGMLDKTGRMQAASGGRLNSFTVWGQATPDHNRFVEALISHPTHLICTMRAKVDYEMVANGNGGTKVVKLGMAPVQRESTEYEFDIFGQINMSHYIEVEARGSLAEQVKGRSFGPDEIGDLGRLIGKWLTEGVALFDPSKPCASKAEDVQAVLDLARKAGRTDADLYKMLAHFKTATFNAIEPAALVRVRKGLEKALADRQSVVV